MWCANHDNQNLTTGLCAHGITRLSIHVQRTTGWDACRPFLSEGLRGITWNTRGLIGSVFSSQKEQRVRNQNIFKKICTKEHQFPPEGVWKWRVSGYSGVGSAISTLWFLSTRQRECGRIGCLHSQKPEEAIVQHVVTCLCRDSLVNIRSGRHDLNCQRPSRASTCLSAIRGRLRLIHPHWHAYPTGVGIVLGDFNICDPDEGRFHAWNQTFTDGDQGKTAGFHCFLSIRPWDCSTWLHEEGLHSPWDHTHSIKDWSYYGSIFPWLKHEVAIVILMYFKTWWSGQLQVITHQHVLSFKTLKSRSTRQAHSKSDPNIPFSLPNCISFWNSVTNRSVVWE